ncbi:adenosine 3'-phospho 5'-phosphosulfate transporter 1-like isoform X2 [Gigantopelta aegis]|uniref:adenosine 3'-phospho 5'-phosphosulfate transporter 1-like isoform X2 n=1 Tax=Gigantopelta aegis TaxID=1735272 RepID=UPI001B88A49A|nr:adenosine 3'-phospho 5'-phosphosulfate transporter 1-like isoform X2 [Gigantopelta aegis]XP_041351547.1 adenosine 3'-phospho 5'-phosphosulfate transporter 1-like isoform X2 [Gigantopelta aegis]
MDRNRIRQMAYIFLGALLLVVTPYVIFAQNVLGPDSTPATPGDSWFDFWLFRLAINILGYATIFVPGALVVRYLKQTKYNETAGPGCLSNFAVLCVFGKEHEKPSLEEGGVSNKSSTVEESTVSRGVRLMFCFVGLQITYLTWGVLQERIMTHEYGKTETTPGEFFKNSTFLVFVNRILAFLISLIVIFFRKQPEHTAPLYKYSYSSFSNIMSSWFQYEALKFVSFPTQVLAKASKVIPVMLMGKVVSKKTYEYYEYFTAVLISVGVSMFLLTSGDVTRHRDTVTTFSGVVLLVGYMLFDSFTSNWQGELFTHYKMSSVQMMAGVNMFSCLLTTVALAEQGGFLESSGFMFRHPEFILHSVLLSICSAAGQLFIFYTISSFGPVTFVIIMTVRQGLAIFLSCMIYGHPVSIVGFLGIMFVFVALFLRIYANQRKRSLKQSQSKPSAPPASVISKI